MARFSTLFLLFYALLLHGENFQKKENIQSGTKNDKPTVKESSPQKNEPIVIEDSSGLSKKELNEKAQKFDKEEKHLKIKDVIESIDENGTVNVTKLVKEKTYSPEPAEGYDWIRTKYGDWLIGHVRSMYNKDLEFDSKEFGIYVFSFKDIIEIKTYTPMQVNIDNVAIFKGIIRLKNDTITIIGGDNTYTFDRSMIISITPEQKRERQIWAGDFSLNVDFRKGNNEQENILFKGHLERRTPKKRFSVDYLGRFNKAAEQTTANDNRFNIKYDIFYTKKFFFSPLVAEFYNNEFQNIDKQYTLGLGVGYTIFDNKKLEWNVATGPAYLYTKYVASDKEKLYDEAISLEAFSRLKYSFNPLNKIKTFYHLTLTKKSSGTYKHHLDITFENDIVKDRIFLDTSFIWDYIESPQSAGDITPFRSDYQFVVGGGLKF